MLDLGIVEETSFFLLLLTMIYVICAIYSCFMIEFVGGRVRELILLW